MFNVTKHNMKKKTLTITAPQPEQGENRKSAVWTRENINQLIELYKEHECLWNHWHEAYKNKDKRNRAIEAICSKLNIEKFEFGKKIHNLRNQFNTEKKKLEQRIEEAGVNIDDTNRTELRCKWSHFESLMFLRHVIEPRPGAYQSIFHPQKKMRLNFNGSEDDINVTTVTPNSNSNTANPEGLSQLQYDDSVNEEVITDDFQSFENELVEIDQLNCHDEDSDQKYQPTQQQDLCTASKHSFIKSSKNKKSLHIAQTSACSQANITDIIEGKSITDLNSSSGTVATPHSQPPIASSTSPSITTPVNYPTTSSRTSNRPVSILRDQWDAFGELVANEFRNLNSENSQKHLKRKIMQAMVEVGEEDDHLVTNTAGSN